MDLLGIHVDSAWIQPTTLRVPLAVHGRGMLCEIERAGSRERPAVVCRTLAGAPPTGPQEREIVGKRLEHLLGVGDGLTAFYEHARDDEPFWRIVQTLEGLHRVGFATPFEGMCWTILRQRQYPNVAMARLRRLRTRFGASVEHEGETHHAFPTATVLAGVALESVRKEVKSRKKAKYLREAAVAFAEMGDDLDVLGDPPDALEERLRAIRGVGPWSSRTLLATAFSRPHLGHVVQNGQITEYWRDVLGRFYGYDIDALWARERANHYGQWDSYWLFYARFTHLAMKRAAQVGTVDT